MPGTVITDHQVPSHTNHCKDKLQELAAAKADISERNARRIDKAVKLLSQCPR